MPRTAIIPVIAVPKYQEEAFEVRGNSVRIDSVRMAVTVVSKPDRVRVEMTRAVPAPIITTKTTGSLPLVSVAPGGVHDIARNVRIATLMAAATPLLRTTSRKTKIRKSMVMALLIASSK